MEDLAVRHRLRRHDHDRTSPSARDEERSSMEPLDRRRVIGGAAVGITAVWAVPAVLSVDAASAATNPPFPRFRDAFGDYGTPGAPPITVTIPASRVQDGDLLLAVAALRFYDSKNAGIDPPPGFAPIVPTTAPAPGTPGGVTSQTPPISPSAEALRAWTWSKTWNTGDPLTFPFTKTLATGFPTRWSAAILIVSGATATGDASGQGQVGASVTATSITTGGANRLVAYLGVASGPTTWTPPAGYTVVGQGPTNSGNPQGLVATAVLPAAGATGAVTATAALPADPAVADNIGFLVELVP
jgi:hypothetical protein